MSTATMPPKNAIAAPSKGETVITYVPLGEREEIHLTLSRVKQFLCVPTKSGRMPTDEQVLKYMMLCKAQCLNPWVNDAYLVGYDGHDGPTFSLITAHQAFLKRAEASPEFDGIESGVVVTSDTDLVERQGDLVLTGEVLIGAWARVHRRDRRIPSYDSLNLATFNTNLSRWKKDPAGMIVKCAEASALRKAFPSTLAAMYCHEEMDRQRESQHVVEVDSRPKADRLAQRILQPSSPSASSDAAEDASAGSQAGSQSESSTGEAESVTSSRPQETCEELMAQIEAATSTEDVTDIAFRRAHLNEAEQTAVESAARARKAALRKQA